MTRRTNTPADIASRVASRPKELGSGACVEDEQAYAEMIRLVTEEGTLQQRLAEIGSDFAGAITPEEKRLNALAALAGC